VWIEFETRERVHGWTNEVILWAMVIVAVVFSFFFLRQSTPTRTKGQNRTTTTEKEKEIKQLSGITSLITSTRRKSRNEINTFT
jgi:preprotein translocase subunit YajC